MKVYSVYDSKGKFFDKPFIQRNSADAVRGFEMAVNEEKHDTMIRRFPADYTLFELGEWDELEGIIKMHDAKINLGAGIQFSKAKVHSVSQ